MGHSGAEVGQRWESVVRWDGANPKAHKAGKVVAGCGRHPMVSERPARFRFAVRILAMDRPAGQGRFAGIFRLSICRVVGVPSDLRPIYNTLMVQDRIAIDQNELADFCRRHGVARLSVFGSVLRSDFDPDRSDVDLLVEFLPNAHKSLFKLAAMEQTLAQMLGRDVDLTTPGSLSKYFRDQVLGSAKVLYDAA
jgi:hypothetical protein